MSRLGTVGLCASVLTILVGTVTAGEPDKPAAIAAATKTESNRPIEAANRFEVVARARIRKALDEKTRLDFNQLPLCDVVAQLEDLHRIDIQFDFKALEDASIGVDTLVTCKRQSRTLRSALRSMLRQFDLTFIIRDESLVITTPDVASAALTTKVYPVGDLAAQRGATLGGEDFKAFINVITDTIAPTSWDEVGGNGGIRVLPGARSLVISQTDEVHEQIVELLAALRQARDAQPPAPKITALGSVVDAVADALRHRNSGIHGFMCGGANPAAAAVPAPANP